MTAQDISPVADEIRVEAGEVNPGIAQPFSAAHGLVNTDLEAANLALVKRFHDEVLLAREPKRADDFVRDDFTQHHPLFGTGKALVTWFTEFFGRFTDLTVAYEVAFAQNNRVLCMTVWRGRHVGTEEKFLWRTSHIYRVKGGRIADHWALIDYSGLEPFGIEAPPHQHQPTTPIDWFGGENQRGNLRHFVNFANEMFVERRKEDAGLFLSEDFVNNDPMAKFAGQTMSGQGIAGFQACFIWYDMVPNMSFTLDHVVAGENHVGGFWSSYGTFADGRPFLLHTVDLYRIQDGKIAEHWTLWDFSQLKQFGMTPPQE